MRIVDLQTFMKLPPGTVFYRIVGGILSNLSVKGKTSDRDSPDYSFVGLGDARINETDTKFEEPLVIADAFKNGANLTIDLIDCRWNFNSDSRQLFAVLDDIDLQGIAALLYRQDSHRQGDLLESAHLLPLPTRF